MTNMHYKRTHWTGPAIISLATALVANTQAQTSDAALNALIKKGLLTEQEARDALADVQKQKAAKPAEEAKPKPAGYVLPLGKEYKLSVGGFLQANAEFNNPDAYRGSFSLRPSPGDQLNKPDGVQGTHNRFRLRRARVNVGGDFLENFDFKLEGDFSQTDGATKENGGSRGVFSGTDLFLNWHQFPEAKFKIGQFKAPFGFEQLTPDTEIFTAERSQVTEAITPERQIGVQLWGRPLTHATPNRPDLLEYWVGMFNGNNRNIAVNDDKTFMYAGRVSSTIFSTKLFDQDFKWRLGANAFTSHYGQGVRIGQTGNLALNSVIPTSTGTLQPLDGSLSSFVTTATNTESRAWGVDQTLTFGPFDIVAEYMEERVKPLDATPRTSFNTFIANGYYAQGSYYFPGRKWQLVGKWESFNPGQDPKHKDDIQSITGGLNYYIKRDSLKLMLNYVHTWSEFRKENPYGNLPQGTKDQFDMLLLRAQVMF
jgi:phosphate-selective porin